MPSSRPTNPIVSLVVAFTDTRIASMPQMSATRVRMAVLCGPILGRSQSNVTSQWVSVPPSCPNKTCGVCEKLVGGCAFPSGIAWREMIADIASADGREQRVRQRVQADIGVGVSVERHVIGDLDSAKYHMRSCDEAMRIVSMADANVGEVELAARTVHIGLAGEFRIVGMARDECNRDARPFGDGRIVGEIIQPFARCLFMGGEKRMQVGNTGAFGLRTDCRAKPFPNSKPSSGAACR